MKKIENSFVVSGFVGKDASIHQFSTASVARFSLAISRTEKNSEETNRTSAFMNVEAWRKNENTSSFDRLVKGTLITVEGYFKPEEWQDADGVKHNRVVLVATKFNEPSPLLPRKGGFGRSFLCFWLSFSLQNHINLLFIQHFPCCYAFISKILRNFAVVNISII